MAHSFQIGSRVYSAQLGVGEILSVEGYGDKEKLTIRFENSGVRQVLSKFFILVPYDNELHASPPPEAPAPAPSASPGAAREDASPPGGTEAAPEGGGTGMGRATTPAPQAPQGRSSAAADGSATGVVPGAAPRHVPASATATTGSIKEALREVLREELGAPEVAMLDRFKGGVMILRPGRAGQKDKEIPIDAFFHKVVILRDRLRVLEQKLNAHPGLSDADKVELQQYITRIYGSLTTFNILFAERDDWFVGQSGSGD